MERSRPVTTLRSSQSGTAERRKVELVYQHLRQLIRDMKILPGTFLKKDKIAAELGVSRAPVSEAIARLAEELLVDIFPQYGSFVAPIRAQDLLDCMFIRRALEVEAARRIAELGDKAVLNKLQINIEQQQQQALDGKNISRLYELDAEFHTIIAVATGLPRAAHTMMAARVPMDRPIEFAQILSERARPTLLEHRRIVEAISRHNPESAGAAMRFHLTQSSLSIEAALTALKCEFQGRQSFHPKSTAR